MLKVVIVVSLTVCLSTPISGLLDRVGMNALCYIVFLIMPVLGKMSDQQRDIRLMASQCFATLVTLMPLEVTNTLFYLHKRNEVLCLSMFI